MRRGSLLSPLLAIAAFASSAWGRSHPRDDEFLLTQEESDAEASSETEDLEPQQENRSDAGGGEVDPWPPRDEIHGHWRLAAGAGLRFGSFLVNNIDTGTNMQAHLDLGLRKRRWWIAGEYALTSITLPGDQLAARGISPLAGGDVDGLVHRFGAFARYSFSRLGCRDAGFDVYAELGAGLQHLRWDDGGAWTRPDVSIGLGIGGWVLGDEDHLGITAGLRVTLAPRNDVEHAPATCAGPCDYPTKPTGTDRSFMFDLTIPFGR